MATYVNGGSRVSRGTGILDQLDQDLNAGALVHTYTVPANLNARVVFIGLYCPAPISQNLGISRIFPAFPFDITFKAEVLVNVTDYYWRPDHDLIMGPGEQIRQAVGNAGIPAVTIRSIINVELFN